MFRPDIPKENPQAKRERELKERTLKLMYKNGKRVMEPPKAVEIILHLEGITDKTEISKYQSIIGKRIKRESDERRWLKEAEESLRQEEETKRAEAQRKRDEERRREAEKERDKYSLLRYAGLIDDEDRIRGRDK